MSQSQPQGEPSAALMAALYPVATENGDFIEPQLARK